jgi:ketosteroid isomerase-like protein
MCLKAKKDICSLFTAYASAFDDADAEAVTKLFAWPAVIWQFGKGHVFQDVEELRENVEALIDVFDEAAIVRMIPDVREVRVAGRSAFADVLWRQEDEDGAVLHEFSCQYLLVEQEGGWRIAAIVNEDAG